MMKPDNKVMSASAPPSDAHDRLAVEHAAQSCTAHHGRVINKPMPAGLTRNETIIWNALSTQGRPLKAYDILDIVKPQSVKSPMTVYRALESLDRKGLIHKLEALNAFVICNHDVPHNSLVFLVCDDCGSVSEVVVDGLDGVLAQFSTTTGFELDKTRLEMRGRCSKCA